MSLDPRFKPVEITLSKQLNVDGSRSLRSGRFDDFYFNPDDGLAETQHVFLAGNHIPLRFENLFSDQSKDDFFSIAEVGFGTGLNFLATLDAWQRSSQAHPDNNDNKTLYYFGIEKHPLSRVALKKALAYYNPLPDLSSALLQIYPDIAGGCYSLDFSPLGYSVKLILLLSDVDLALNNIEVFHQGEPETPLNPSGFINAWYLDGFAPSKNHAMWSNTVFAKLASRSHVDATLATFSVASHVKDGLQANGFLIEKQRGFGKKREMLTARLHTKKNPGLNSVSQTQPQSGSMRHSAYLRCIKAQSNTDTNPYNIAIIGAGIAGCTLAYKLAKAGCSVSLYDAAHDLATGASGNDVAILHTRRFQQRSIQADFFEAAQQSAFQFYRNEKLAFNQDDKRSGGIWQISHLNKSPTKNSDTNEIIAEAIRQEQEYCNHKPEVIGGIDAKGSCLFYQGGALDPKAICSKLTKHPRILIKLQTEISAITPVNQKAVMLKDNNGDERNYSHAIVCSGFESDALTTLNWLPLKPVSGQTLTLQLAGLSKTTIARLKKLSPYTLCADGYLTVRVHDDETVDILFGASYHPGSSTREISLADILLNLDSLVDLLAVDNSLYTEFIERLSRIRSMLITDKNEDRTVCSLDLGKEAIVINSRHSVRGSTTDYLPIVGQIVDRSQFYETYKPLSLNARQSINVAPAYIPRLYTLCGLGSHGFTTAPLLSEMLKCQILQQPQPVSDELRRALSPQRFLLRSIIRGGRKL